MKNTKRRDTCEKPVNSNFQINRQAMLIKILRYGFCFFLLVLLSLAPDTAMAHLVNTSVGEFYSGMMHPMTSAEHLLPILALALLASQLGKRAARGVVLLFPIMLAVGVLMGSYYPELGFVQMANLLLLVVLGGALIVAGSVPPLMAPVFSVGTGLILGYRSGVDMAAAAVGLQFIPGVALTGLIIVALFAAWIPEVSSSRLRTLRAFLGAGFSLAGMVMILYPTLGLELQSIRRVGIPGQKDIVAMVKSEELSISVVLAALTGSLIWGAGHALTPGHGKAIVAAYLVGERSTPWHAVYLGLTVTTTHTLLVFALGLVTLFASRFILPDQLYPWLGLISGLIVVGLGATMAASRIRNLKKEGYNCGHHHHDGDSHLHSHDDDDQGLHPVKGHQHSWHDDDHGSPHCHQHDHDHSHRHEGHHHHHSHNGYGHSHLPSGADGTAVTWRSLLGLGISGGLLPCPAALILLLAAVSLGRVGFGMVLVTVFSLGLAGVLITVGLLFVKGGRLLASIPQVSIFGRWIPVVSSMAVLCLGALITIQAAVRI